jgi:hypothetical protein
MELATAAHVGSARGLCRRLAGGDHEASSDHQSGGGQKPRRVTS